MGRKSINKGNRDARVGRLCHSGPTRSVDERDTIFSRREIKPGEERYHDYYERNPEKLETDLKWRSKPGLLAEGTTEYNRFAFAAAHASFDAVAAFFDLRSESMEHGAGGMDLLTKLSPPNLGGVAPSPRGRGGMSSRQKEATRDLDDVSDSEPGFSKESLSAFIKGWGLKMGAHSVGVAEMKDYHYYTVGGRRERYGVPVEMIHPYGIAITVEMDYELTMTGPHAPVVMESSRQYLNSGMIATQLALTLRRLGYEAKTHIDGNYDVICPLVARDAGLGEIGRMGLLMTPAVGPRVRIAVVTTDAPLVADAPFDSDSMLDFCVHCRKCARVCPAAAIPSGDPEEMPGGGARWLVNHEACFNYWCMAGTDCGRCMAVCPYSHKDKPLHRLVRWGIKRSALFRRAAIVLDDLVYGRRPLARRDPKWLG